MARAIAQCLSWNTLPSGNRGADHVNVPHDAAPSTSSGTGDASSGNGTGGQGTEAEGLPFDKLRERKQLRERSR